jgi:hypothetical protein
VNTEENKSWVVGTQKRTSEQFNWERRGRRKEPGRRSEHTQSIMTGLLGGGRGEGGGGGGVGGCQDGGRGGVAPQALNRGGGPLQRAYIPWERERTRAFSSHPREKTRTPPLPPKLHHSSSDSTSWRLVGGVTLSPKPSTSRRMTASRLKPKLEIASSTSDRTSYYKDLCAIFIVWAYV